MATSQFQPTSRRRSFITWSAALLTLSAAIGALSQSSSARSTGSSGWPTRNPALIGRAVLPFDRRVYRVDLRQVSPTGTQPKTQLVDLSAIPDPGLVSLPAIHPGDLGLGDPFWVMCESVEAVHMVASNRLLVGCDNNLPNSGRNPTRPGDNELIIAVVPGMVWD